MAGTLTDPIQKTPAEILVRGFDWAEKLAELGGSPTITLSVWSAPAGLTLSAGAVNVAQTRITVSGGTVGPSYNVENLVTFSDGRKSERCFYIKVVDHICL